MKKLLLSFTAIAAIAASAQAQAPRLALYEEFTGEDCAPCSEVNPGLWTLMGAAGNDGVKVQLLSFQEPIPHLGFLYYQTKAVSDARLAYYPNVTGTPTGIMDGAITHPNVNPNQSYPGAPEDMTQADIDAEAATTSPFTITVSSSWNATYDQVTSIIKVTAVGAYAPAAGNVKLRAALVESIHYPTAPGITGEGTELDFHNVVRGMYPDANGTVISNTWAVGDTLQDTIVMNVPVSVDRNNNPYMVVWIQNDVNKAVAQAGKSNILTAPALTADAGIDSVTSRIFTCGTPTTSSASVTGILHNYGTATLTAATIYTKVNTGLTGFGPWTSHSWTGSLAPDATTPVTYTVTGIPAPGTEFNRVYDSVDVAGDLNFGNSTNYGNVWLQVNHTTFSQISTDFENGMPAGWTDLNGLFGIYESGTAVNLGHNNSALALAYENFNYPAGTTDYLILPNPGRPDSGNISLNFYYAYAQQLSTDNDALDVVYSTDCGGTWTSLWHKAGADLATVAASPINFNTGAGLFLPASNSDYAYGNADLSSMPANSMVALRTVAGNGNILWIDDIAIDNAPLSVGNVLAAANNISLYPNPAKDNATLALTLSAATHVQIDIIDAIGRTVSNVANQNMNAGAQKINISTANLATGIYNIKIVTDAGTTTQRLSVIK